jgi:WD40 repeat protein
VGQRISHGLQRVNRIAFKHFCIEWFYTSHLHDTRLSHTATVLTNGQVLVTGGLDLDNSALKRCELYDPSTGKWTKTGDMHYSRWLHAASLLPNGNVLVTGGDDDSYKTCELYDPLTGNWTKTGSLHYIRVGHTATVLPNGKVLVIGEGYAVKNGAYNESNCELYDPSTGNWTLTGSTNDF